jgi:hypothetical protein
MFGTKIGNFPIDCPLKIIKETVKEKIKRNYIRLKESDALYPCIGIICSILFSIFFAIVVVHLFHMPS